MVLKNIKVNAEVMFLIVIFGVFLWAGYGNLSDHRIAHDGLFGYFSSDAIQDAAFVEGIEEVGNYKYQPFWTAAGLNDTIAWYAPVLFHPIVMVSELSKIEAYDILIFVVYLFAVLSSLVMYFIIKDYNKNIAILSLPLMLYIFFGRFYTGFLLGQWGYTTGCIFMISAFWAVTKISEKRSYILLGIFIAGSIGTHVSEAAFILGLIFLYLFYNIITRRVKGYMFAAVLLAGIVSIIVSSYMLYVVILSTFPQHAQGQGGILFGNIITGDMLGYPVVYIKFFGFSLVFIVLGTLISLKQYKKLHPSIMAAFLMLAVGFSNYVGGSIGSRSFQNRFLWPIYLSIFFGMSTYFLIKLFVKQWKSLYSMVLCLILVFVFLSTSYEKPTPGALVNKERLDGLRWFQDNSPENAVIFFFYGDPYSQTSILGLTKRMHYLVDFNKYFSAINENKIKREYFSRTTHGNIYYETSFFKSQSYEDKLGEDYFRRERDICDYEYYVFDKVSSQPILAQYNMILASKLAEKDYIKPVFSNNIMLILENQKPGEDCIEEQTIA